MRTTTNKRQGVVEILLLTVALLVVIAVVYGVGGLLESFFTGSIGGT